MGQANATPKPADPPVVEKQKKKKRKPENLKKHQNPEGEEGDDSSRARMAMTTDLWEAAMEAELARKVRFSNKSRKHTKTSKSPV